jgi:uncharacterized protein (TIGR03083 family)
MLGPDHRRPVGGEILSGGPGDAGLLAWFRDGHAALAQTLATADPAVACATFMPAPSPLAFWARRQAHETAIHRADADSAAGTMPEYEPGFAADGIDELIMGFGRRRKYQPRSTAGGAWLRVLATDTGDAWLVEAQGGDLQPRRDADDHQEAGCTVSGPASSLYLYLWNRADAARAGVTVAGDPGLLSSWQSSVRVPVGVTG